jgi:hypothetical protein
MSDNFLHGFGAEQAEILPLAKLALPHPEAGRPCMKNYNSSFENKGNSVHYRNSLTPEIDSSTMKRKNSTPAGTAPLRPGTALLHSGTAPQYTETALLTIGAASPPTGQPPGTAQPPTGADPPPTGAASPFHHLPYRNNIVTYRNSSTI